MDKSSTWYSLVIFVFRIYLLGGKAASVVEGFDANALLEQVSKSMNGAIAGYRNVLSNMRPGRADKRVFDSLTLEAYDDVVPVTQVAQVAVVSSTKFQLNVFDPTVFPCWFILNAWTWYCSW